MKILILGAKGNLGQQLVKVFSSSTLTSASSVEPLRAANDFQVIGWDIEEIDITNQEQVKNKIIELKPDIIVNAAAYNAVDKCETDEKQYELAKKLNGEAVGYIADAAIKIKAVLVHYSTDYVFSNTNQTNLERIKRIMKRGGFREDDQPAPVNKYAETKLMGEQELIKRGEQGLKWYLIRTSKLFGVKGASQMTKQSFFDIMLEIANQRESGKNSRESNKNLANKGIDVVDEEVSCFTYTPDLAKATSGLVKSGKPYGIYHLVNQGPCTWYQAAKELFKLAKINVKVNPVSSDKFPRPAKRPKYSVLINTKLKPMRNWQEALREYLNK